MSVEQNIEPPFKIPNSTKPDINTHEIEQMEEQKLKNKYPQVAGRPHGGQSAFLQKRLNKGQKFFDSGDYQMAKQKGVIKRFPPGGAMPPMMAQPGSGGTGETIPTPDNVPARKTSILNSKPYEGTHPVPSSPPQAT
jgi:hypothetical protein